MGELQVIHNKLEVIEDSLERSRTTDALNQNEIFCLRRDLEKEIAKLKLRIEELEDELKYRVP